MRHAIGWPIFFVLLFFGIGWVVQGNEFFMYKFFAPREEAVHRQTFEESKAYNDGMAQELSQMELDYVKGDKDQKAALRSVILHRIAGYDTSRLSPDLQGFVSGVRRDALMVTP
jgi:hypothetical protein